MTNPANRHRALMVVTGGGRGIGAAVARLGAARGYDVVVNYVADDAAAEKVVSEIRVAGGKAEAIRADISDKTQVGNLFDKAEAAFGPLTALVNCAGISGHRRSLAETDVEDLARIVDVNLVGAMICAREAIRRMTVAGRADRGGIVFMSSQAATRGGNKLAAYAASKSAINILARALAQETGNMGIRVNAVSPGVIATDLQPLDDADWVARTVAGIPAGRLGSGDDVAKTVLWLLSPESAYVNGAVIDVTGGR